MAGCDGKLPGEAEEGAAARKTEQQKHPLQSSCRALPAQQPRVQAPAQMQHKQAHSPKIKHKSLSKNKSPKAPRFFLACIFFNEVKKKKNKIKRRSTEVVSLAQISTVHRGHQSHRAIGNCRHSSPCTPPQSEPKKAADEKHTTDTAQATE